MGATIRGELDLSGATLHKPSKPDGYALNLDGARISHFILPTGKVEGSIVLYRADIDHLKTETSHRLFWPLAGRSAIFTAHFGTTGAPRKAGSPPRAPRRPPSSRRPRPARKPSSGPTNTRPTRKPTRPYSPGMRWPMFMSATANQLPRDGCASPQPTSSHDNPPGRRNYCAAFIAYWSAMATIRSSQHCGLSLSSSADWRLLIITATTSFYAPKMSTAAESGAQATRTPSSPVTAEIPCSLPTDYRCMNTFTFTLEKILAPASTTTHNQLDSGTQGDTLAHSRAAYAQTRLMGAGRATACRGHRTAPQDITNNPRIAWADVARINSGRPALACALEVKPTTPAAQCLGSRDSGVPTSCLTSTAVVRSLT